MKITLTSGVGTGSTLLSAFDAALQDCGVSNYNIIVLSSVIPPHSEIVKEKYVTPDTEYGDRLYVVRAEERCDIKGKFIGAAIGWYQREDKGGLFVEHEMCGNSYEEVEQKLRSDVFSSLKDLCKFRNYPCQEKDINIEMNITQVQDSPTCVQVMAVYKSERWE